MHKATPITQRASALKQTYNPDLVAGAGKAASKFKSYRADKTEEEKPAENENDQTNPEVEIDDNTNPPNPNPDDNNGDNDPNSPDGTASGKGGGDGEEQPKVLTGKEKRKDRRAKRKFGRWLNKEDKETGLTGLMFLII